MKKHFAFCCLAYAYFGFGMGVVNFGIKAGLGYYTCISIFCTSVIIFFIMVFTSMEKVKEMIKNYKDKKDADIPLVN